MKKLFQHLPSVDKLLKTTRGQQLNEQFGHSAMVRVCRELLQQARQQIKFSQKLPHFCADEQVFLQAVADKLQHSQQVKIQVVHNLTGTVLHTNLGRALWSEAAQQAGLNAMRNNVALEYDLQAGQRSHRDNYISELLCQLTGAEAACVVNNNAAAVLLMLVVLGKDKQVIISRGELIEIGGAFRIPDIMQQAGCQLREVGTTNRTHLSDYAKAIDEDTALLMKVHSSNYQICGFTAAVNEQQLVALAKPYNLPVISDLGSGALIDLRQYGLPYEPTVQEKIAQGVDLVSFSGDKLLGGVQAGIIVGKKALIDQLQAHPLKRVLRCDKVILAGLEATLRLYLQPEKLLERLPTLTRLTVSEQLLSEQAQQLKVRLEKQLNSEYSLNIEPSSAQIGSGSQPMARIPSVAVTIQGEHLTHLMAHFKSLPEPIIGRLEQDKIWLDLRSVADLQGLLNSVENININ